MQKIKPVGQKLIVFPLPTEDTETEAGIVVMDMQLCTAKIIEVSEENKELYSEGDIIIIPKETGTAIHYQKKACIWVQSNIDVWGKITKE